MVPRIIDQLFQLILPVALILFALNLGANMTGFGKHIVKKLTEKVTHGVIAIVALWMLIAIICQSLSR